MLVSGILVRLYDVMVENKKQFWWVIDSEHKNDKIAVEWWTNRNKRSVRNGLSWFERMLLAKWMNGMESI